MTDELLNEEKTYTDQEGNEYVVIATKLRKDEYIKLCRIAEKNGNSKYTFLQWAVSMIIRLMDMGSRITETLTKACLTFGVETKFVNRYNLCNPSVEPEVDGAIFFLGNKHMKGLQPVYVDKPFMGDAMMTENVMDILDKLMQHLNPAMYKKMMREVKRREIANVYHLLVEWTDESDGAEDLQEIEDTFADDRRSDWGRKEKEGGPYRRTMNNSMETYEKRLHRFEQHQTTMDLDFDE